MASHADLPEDLCSHQHVASDSDSEVYCDSVDQFGMEQVSETMEVCEWNVSFFISFSSLLIANGH